jgi:hypothetical protein
MVYRGYKANIGIGRCNHVSNIFSAPHTILILVSKEEEKPLNNNQEWKPIHQKYKANEDKRRHNPKKQK